MKFLERIQGLPEQKRKIILWSIVVIVGILLFIFYIRNVQQRLSGLKTEESKQQLKIPELREKSEGLPKIEIPEIEIPEIYEK